MWENNIQTITPFVCFCFLLIFCGKDGLILVVLFRKSLVLARLNAAEKQKSLGFKWRWVNLRATLEED